jgi:hypothetical protein
VRSPADRSLGIAVCAIALAFGGTLSAAPRGRVATAPFSGAGQAPVRAAVLKALRKNGFRAVGGKQIQGVATKLGVSLEGDAAFAAVARELGLSAFITGEVSKKRAKLTVRDGAGGSAVAEAVFTGAKPKKVKAAVAAGFWRRLGSAVRRCRPPEGSKSKPEVAGEPAPAGDEQPEASAQEVRRAPPGEAVAAEQGQAGGEAREKESAGPDADAKPQADPDSEAPSREEAPAPKRRARAAKAAAPEPVPGDTVPAIALELGVGGKALYRRLTYHQDVLQKLSPYTLSPGAEVGAWFEAYPAAFATFGGPADLGLFGGFDYGVGVKSKTADGSLLSTQFQDFILGLKLRLPLGPFNPFVSAAYGQQRFQLASVNGDQVIPTVDYKFVRGGLGARLVFARALFMDLEGAYLFVTDLGSAAGEIGSSAYFPLGKAYAVDADASFGVRLASILVLRVGADFRQYGLDFHVRPTDPLIVGGAVDRYIAAWAGLEIAFDGVAPD